MSNPAHQNLTESVLAPPSSRGLRVKAVVNARQGLFLRWSLSGLCLLWLAACADTDSDPGSCGDGELQGEELCDDGNDLPGDGCSTSCSTEPGWDCGGLICVTRCGDQIQAGQEACDDGNTDNGDGCSSTCTVEGASTEVCDDAADNDGDTLVDCEDPDCADSCPSPGPEVACSDGVDNDGDDATDCEDSDCEASCLPPDPEDCAVAGDEDSNGLADCADPACTCVCGDGITQNEEQCDDGSENSDTEPDACRTSCSPAFCGDGVIDSEEECDGISEGSGAACLDCALVDRPACGDSDATIIVDVNRPVVDVSVPLADSTDDVATDASCGTRGGKERDLLLLFPTAGRYLIQALSGASAGRLVLAELNDCPEGTSVGTCAGPSSRSNAWLTLDVETGSRRWLRADAFASDVTSGSIRVSQVDAVLAPGQSCTADDARAVCQPGSQCISVDGRDPQCVADGESGPVTGDPCVPVGPLACGDRLVCRGTPTTCEPQEAASCDELLIFTDVASRTEDDSLVWSVLLGASGNLALRSTCEGLLGRAAVQVTRDRRDWLQITANGEGGAPVGLSARSSCGLANSESVCRFAADGNAELWLEPGSTDDVVVIAGLGLVEIGSRLVPSIDNGRPCGTDVAGRCEVGSSCVDETCTPDLAGSCSDPVPALDAGIGDLTGSGLLIPIDMGGADELQIDCGARDPGDPDTAILVPYLEQVIQFEAPATGRYEATLRGAGATAGVRIDVGCAGLPGSAVCNAPPATSGEFRRGAQVRVVVSSRQVETFAVSLRQLATLADRGAACTDSAGCMSPFTCISDVCSTPILTEGSACVPGLEFCAEPAVCSPEDRDGAFICADGEVGQGESCEQYAGLPACNAGLVCDATADYGLSVCELEGGLPGDPCIRTTDCRGSLFCIEGVCTEDEGGDVGDACRSNAECNTGLACDTLSEVCLALNDFVCSSLSTCPGDLVCNLLTRCVAAASAGQPCSDEVPCATGLDCIAGEGGSFTCGIRLRGESEPCVVSAECLPELYCDATVCLTRRSSGSSCRNGGAPDQCVVGESCRLDFSSGSFRCQPD
jgi:cysteine-rich repeat protein